jgi:hypothetical protein
MIVGNVTDAEDLPEHPEKYVDPAEILQPLKTHGSWY